MELRRVFNRHREDLFGLPNVVGVGQGVKRIKGRATGEPAIVVLVSKKVPLQELKRDERVPRTLSKVAVDVIEVGEIRLLGRTEYQRPAPPGVSIGHYRVTAGTLGAVVRDRQTGELLILSNNHVLANSTSGNDGRAAIGDPIYQPGPYDGGGPDQLIGYLYRFIPMQKDYEEVTCRHAQFAQRLANKMLHLIRPSYRLAFYRRLAGENLVDAAVAKPVSPEAITPEILGIGPVRGIREAHVGMRVLKSGRSSGLNSGEILAVGATVQVTLEEGRSGLFSDQFVTQPLAKPGDSGSLVLDEEHYAVGLLFAGSEQSSICNRIQNVLELLQVEF
ncbi:MAG: hypothetical protein H5U00_02250 [Clostridia bacterium]|nr:hypothetical protein [Clostridia bacterium]